MECLRYSNHVRRGECYTHNLTHAHTSLYHSSHTLFHVHRMSYGAYLFIPSLQLFLNVPTVVDLPNRWHKHMPMVVSLLMIQIKMMTMILMKRRKRVQKMFQLCNRMTETYNNQKQTRKLTITCTLINLNYLQSTNKKKLDSNFKCVRINLIIKK